MSDCIFCAIAAGDIPADLVASSERAVAFRDLNPQAPVHVLVIPRGHHVDLPAVASADPSLAGEMFALAGEVTRSEGVDGSGFRLVANTGSDGGQTVHHAHIHVLGGRQLTWPPG